METINKKFDPATALRLWSALTHGLGAILALVGTTILLCRAFFLEKPLDMFVFSIYGFSMVCLYTASTLYHSVRGSDICRIILRKYDHCSIYLLIAGSYTPICILALSNSIGYILLSVIWSCTIVGIVLTAIRLNIPAWVSSLIYIIMGWMAAFAISPLSKSLSVIPMSCLVIGGIFYTIGGIMYALKWPCRNNINFGCHEIFHIFILLGSVSHFVMMFYI